MEIVPCLHQFEKPTRSCLNDFRIRDEATGLEFRKFLVPCYRGLKCSELPASFPRSLYFPSPGAGKGEVQKRHSGDEVFAKLTNKHIVLNISSVLFNCMIT